MLCDDLQVDSGEQVRAVHKAVGRTDIHVELLTTGRSELAALIADRFSSGRLFLARYAPHQLPPNRVGFGANTGIDDVHYLA
jgi:2-polyprenyl-6-methoxyphenol hydroxylase-like FAD-dependent oxidoreductase